MKKWLKKPLVTCYLVALGIWIVLFCVGYTKSVWYSTRGNGGEMVVPQEDIGFVALISPKPNAEIPEGDWLVSTDYDPQIRWVCNGRYIEQIRLKMKSFWPTGAVVLYYRTPEQADFSPLQMVYAQQKGEEYIFDLKGKKLEEIRIDPASQGGVILQVEEIKVVSKGISAIVPTWQQLALLLGLPPVMWALWEICLKNFCSKVLKDKKNKM